MRDRVLAQARDVLEGRANADWRADWTHEWAQVLIDLHAKLEDDEWREAVRANAGARWHYEDLEAELERIRESIRRLVDNNEQGPDYGWTHPDEEAETLRRSIRLVLDDVRTHERVEE